MGNELEQKYAASDAHMGSLLERRKALDVEYFALQPAAVPELQRALNEWNPTEHLTELELMSAGYPVLKTMEMLDMVRAEPAAGVVLRKSVAHWAEQQRAKGRGVLVKGNPLPPARPYLVVYATKYLDVATGGDNPGWVLYEPKDGWRDSSELAETSNLQLAIRNYWPWMLGIAGVLGTTGVIFWLRRKR